MEIFLVSVFQDPSTVRKDWTHLLQSALLEIFVPIGCAEKPSAETLFTLVGKKWNRGNWKPQVAFKSLHLHFVSANVYSFRYILKRNDGFCAGSCGSSRLNQFWHVSKSCMIGVLTNTPSLLTTHKNKNINFVTLFDILIICSVSHS